MKKALMILIIIGSIWACNDNPGDDEQSPNPRDFSECDTLRNEDGSIAKLENCR